MSKYIKPPYGEQVEWFDGPPPEVGWWPASVGRNTDSLRYWDGLRWSFSVPSSKRAIEVGQYATIPSLRGNDGICWTHRWWEAA